MWHYLHYVDRADNQSGLSRDRGGHCTGLMLNHHDPLGLGTSPAGVCDDAASKWGRPNAFTLRSDWLTVRRPNPLLCFEKTLDNPTTLAPRHAHCPGNEKMKKTVSALATTPTFSPWSASGVVPSL
jgi:hypothetical protein